MLVLSLCLCLAVGSVSPQGSLRLQGFFDNLDFKKEDLHPSGNAPMMPLVDSNVKPRFRQEPFNHVQQNIDQLIRLPPIEPAVDLAEQVIPRLKPPGPSVGQENQQKELQVQPAIVTSFLPAIIRPIPQPRHVASQSDGLPKPEPVSSNLGLSIGQAKKLPEAEPGMIPSFLPPPNKPPAGPQVRQARPQKERKSRPAIVTSFIPAVIKPILQTGSVAGQSSGLPKPASDLSSPGMSVGQGKKVAEARPGMVPSFLPPPRPPPPRPLPPDTPGPGGTPLEAWAPSDLKFEFSSQLGSFLPPKFANPIKDPESGADESAIPQSGAPLVQVGQTQRTEADSALLAAFIPTGPGDAPARIALPDSAVLLPNGLQMTTVPSNGTMNGGDKLFNMKQNVPQTMKSEPALVPAFLPRLVPQRPPLFPVPSKNQSLLSTDDNGENGAINPFNVTRDTTPPADWSPSPGLDTPSLDTPSLDTPSLDTPRGSREPVRHETPVVGSRLDSHNNSSAALAESRAADHSKGRASSSHALTEEYGNTFFALEAYRYVLPIVLVVLMLLTVAIVVALSRQIKQGSEMSRASLSLLISIALADFLAVAVSLPDVFYLYHMTSRHGAIPFQYCSVLIALERMTPIPHTASTWITMVLAIQRYICVSRPFYASKLLTVKFSLLIVAVAFLASIALHICRFFDTRFVPVTVASSLGANKTIESCRLVYAPWISDSANYETVYIWCRVFLAQLIPCAVLLLFGILLLRHLRRTESSLRQMNVVNSKRSRERRRLSVFVIVVVCIVFTVEFTIGVFLCIYSIQLTTSFDGLEYTAMRKVAYGLDMLIYISYFAIFLTYCIMAREFRSLMRRLIKRLKCTGIPFRPKKDSIAVETSISTKSSSLNKSPDTKAN